MVKHRNNLIATFGLIVLGCVLVGTPLARAEISVDVINILRAGGNTVAGPGDVELDPEESQDIFDVELSTVRIPNICATLVNIGEGAMRIKFSNGGLTFPFIREIVAPGHSRGYCTISPIRYIEVCCLRNKDTVCKSIDGRIAKEEDKKFCRGVWRVDQRLLQPVRGIHQTAPQAANKEDDRIQPEMLDDRLVSGQGN